MPWINSLDIFNVLKILLFHRLLCVRLCLALEMHLYLQQLLLSIEPEAIRYFLNMNTMFLTLRYWARRGGLGRHYFLSEAERNANRDDRIMITTDPNKNKVIIGGSYAPSYFN